LENIIEKAIVLLDGDSIGIADLPLEVRQYVPVLAPILPDGIITVSVGQNLKQIEKSVIQRTLKLFGGDKQKTAKALKISERKLWYKLKEYEQDDE
jgi:two-component system, NtrC family, response regulator AtoC